VRPAEYTLVAPDTVVRTMAIGMMVNARKKVVSRFSGRSG
jgi:hypothetical protein